LIEICYAEVRAGSELDTNLRQMDGCTKDLVGKLIYGLIFLAH
jgi:hypothetical protein